MSVGAPSYSPRNTLSFSEILHVFHTSLKMSFTEVSVMIVVI
jgi:hypothetical protein